MSNRTNIDTVSAVIPTRNRLALLKRAVVSALAQSHPPIEVVVVIDGPDPETQTALAAMRDSRIRIVPLDQSVGAAEARNIGVQHSSGHWIAFLDDDDEWLASKLERQLAAVCRESDCQPIVATKVFARNANRTDIWPLTSPQEPYSDYLLVRKRLRFGEGLLQTSTLMAPRELLTQVPFRKGLRKHQDWDWILRCTELQTFRILFIEEPLAVWYLDDDRTRVSQRDDWRASLDWIRSVRHLVTKRAYASFLANHVGRQAAAARAWRSAFSIAVETVREGQPATRDLALLLLPWLVPTRAVRFLRSALNRLSAVDKPLVCKQV